MSLQKTIIADKLILHQICANDDIKAILGRFWSLGGSACCKVITFQHADPPEDQMCQVSFQYHKLHRFYVKSPYQLLRSFEMTHMLVFGESKDNLRLLVHPRISVFLCQIEQNGILYWP